MRKTALFILFCAMASFAASINLVGISGKKYPLTIQQKQGEKYVAAKSITKILYFTWKERNKVYTCTQDGYTLTVTANKKSASIAGEAVPLKYTPYYSKGSVWVECGELAELFTSLTRFTFTYNEKKNSIVISKGELALGMPTVSGIVVIDPGHGGKDPGAIGKNGTMEKNVVLPISKYLQSYLKKKSNITVHMTRSKDTFIPLGKRTSFANDKKADLFVSIHANASPKKNKVDGYKLYFLSEAENETDEQIAEAENAVIELEEDVDGEDFINSILMDMATTEYQKESQDLSILAVDYLDKYVKKVKRLHSGVGQANFYVLRGAEMPALLVETAFISNEKEEKLLSDTTFQKDFAEALGFSIMKFLDKYGATK